MSKYTFAFLFLTSLFVSFVALLAWQAAVVAQPESEPPLALPAAPLAPLSSYRRVQNLDSPRDKPKTRYWRSEGGFRNPVG